MTATFFLNGAPAGSISFLPDGTPIAAPGAMRLMRQLPVLLLPFLDPQSTIRTLRGMANRDFVIPRFGTIRVEVL